MEYVSRRGAEAQRWDEIGDFFALLFEKLGELVATNPRVVREFSVTVHHGAGRALIQRRRKNGACVREKFSGGATG